VTTVLVRQLDATGSWWVLGAATANIAVEQPKAFDLIASPVHLHGTSTAFEATVSTELRQDGTLVPLATGFVNGGSMGELSPVDGSLAFPEPTARAGALVLTTVSMESGHVWEATVLRVRFARDRTTVGVWFTGPDGTSLVRVERTVPRTTAVLRAALEQLLAGPTSTERAAGLRSWFSGATAGMLRDVALSPTGAATVDLGDLRGVIPGASSSAGSDLLLRQLDATVFQFPSVTSVVYRIAANCEAFTEWLQYGGCVPRVRP
jgi:hypothetical protein